MLSYEIKVPIKTFSVCLQVKTFANLICIIAILHHPMNLIIVYLHLLRNPTTVISWRLYDCCIDQHGVVSIS